MTRKQDKYDPTRPPSNEVPYYFDARPRCFLWADDAPRGCAEAVYMYVVRHQLGFGNPSTFLTEDEFAHGRWSGRGDKRRRMDKGCGYTDRESIREARHWLKATGWLHMEDVGDKARPRVWYCVIISKIKSYDDWAGNPPTVGGKPAKQTGDRAGKPPTDGGKPASDHKRETLRKTLPEKEEKTNEGASHPFRRVSVFGEHVEDGSRSAGASMDALPDRASTIPPVPRSGAVPAKSGNSDAPSKADIAAALDYLRKEEGSPTPVLVLRKCRQLFGDDATHAALEIMKTPTFVSPYDVAIPGEN